jgi:cytochrome c oxidase subunit 2
MTFVKRLAFLPALACLLLALAGTALAGGPEPRAIGFQPPATPTAEKIEDFHNLLLWIISAISVFVLALMLYVMVRFRESANPTPSRTVHNTLIEVLWTVIPILILVFIAVPSFRLLYFADRAPAEEVEMTIKAIGKQWYWSYEYPDHGNFTFDAIMLEEEELQPGQPRLLATDNAVVLPVDTTIRILVTAGDVLHNFAMPAFGIKLDGVPGRINETWAYIPAEHAGETFYGQCSELCGVGHSYMPIMVKMVTKEEFAAWVEQAQEEFARVDSPENRTAVAASAAAAE